MIGLIVSGGKINSKEILEKYYNMSDVCIAVDKGAEYLLNLELEFDIAIGDFDSIDKKYFEKIEKEKILKLNKEKDDTDTEAAVDYLIREKVKTIYLLSSTGTRLDHTLSNISLLKKIQSKGIEGYVIDDNNKVRFAKKENIVSKEYENISIIPVGIEGINVTLDGFYYKLNNDDIEYGSSRCISNYLINSTGKIYINKGNALIIESSD